MNLPDPPVLVITDRHQARMSLEALAEAVFGGGCRWLLLRDKDLPRDERVDIGRRLVELAVPYCATVSMSGDPAAAIEAGAAGVHLPRDGDVQAARAQLGEGALIGVSAHDAGEAARAAAAGADYATLSPVFISVSKPGYGPAVGLDGLAAVASSVGIPILALGGVTAARVPGCLKAGGAGVAVMGGIMRAENPAGAISLLVDAHRFDVR